MIDFRDPVRTGSAVLGLACMLMTGCAADYVYIQDGKSERAVRQDYIGCAEQQFKGSNDTTMCMETRGYRTLKIDEASRAAEHSSSGQHAFFR
ncbi:MAG TPA: hypothetical protein VGJ57_04270 [Nitrospirales bacterium]|jgi:hypothetical protein